MKQTNISIRKSIPKKITKTVIPVWNYSSNSNTKIPSWNFHEYIKPKIYIYIIRSKYFFVSSSNLSEHEHFDLLLSHPEFWCETDIVETITVPEFVFLREKRSPSSNLFISWRDCGVIFSCFQAYWCKTNKSRIGNYWGWN